MEFEELEEELDLDEIKSLIDNTEPNKDAATTQPESGETEKTVDQKKKESSVQKSIVLYLHDLAYLIAGIVLVFLIFFRIVIVSGDSMYNTLVDGDYLLLTTNVFYRDPQPGDIIVASKESYNDGAPIIKRVIATEGQTVSIDFVTGEVSVDGVVLDEDYIYSPTTSNEGMSFPLVVEENCIFVLGDNRGRSKDSRHPEIGQIDKRQIVGKAIFLVFPGTNHGKNLPDFDRIGGLG